MKFPKKGRGGGGKGRSEIFRKFIRIRGDGLPFIMMMIMVMIYDDDDDDDDDCKHLIGETQN